MISSITVDLELHKAIESHRQTLGESQVDIVKRVLKATNESAITSVSAQSSAATAVEPKNRLARRGGDYKLDILGKTIKANSLKDILKQAILLTEQKKPGFLEQLASHRTSRGRRIIARKPEEIYPGKPGLVANCAERLDSKWWYDTNISADQCQRYLQVVAGIGRFPPPQLEK